MTTDSTYSLQTDISTSSIEHLLHTLFNEVSALSEKVNLILQMLEDKKNKKTAETTNCRQHVNEKVVALLLKHPCEVWTSESLAKKIGCSGSAVRQTATWQAHRKTREKEKQNRYLRKGYKDKQGNIEAYAD